MLVNAPYLFVYRRLNFGRNFYFPLGIGYIAAVLKEKGYDVSLLDVEPLNLTLEGLAARVRHEKPHLVGISCATANFNAACEIGDAVKQVSGAKVILGGVHATVMWKEILAQCPQFDAAAIGEGEFTLLDLCKSANAIGQIDFSGIPGLAFRDGSKIHKNADRSPIAPLDQLPYPARELMDLSLYRSQVHIYRGRKSASMITSRGCPFGCSFCASYQTMGRTYRAHSPEYVLGEIEYLYKTHHVRDIAFADDEFTLNRKRTVELCNLLIESKLDIGWYCFSRVSDVDEELLALMKKAGCFGINFGVESADARVLKNIGKKITVQEAERAITAANRLGIKTVAGYMFGNRGDTQETMDRTIDFARRVSPVIASFNVMVPFPGTRDYDLLKAEHPELEDCWEDFTPVKVSQYIRLEDGSHETLQNTVSSAYLRFYFRPSQVLLILRHIAGYRELLALIRGMMGLLGQVLAWRGDTRAR